MLEICLRGSKDRTRASGARDAGSIPAGGTIVKNYNPHSACFQILIIIWYFAFSK